jgi:hypothetical protein
MLLSGTAEVICPRGTGECQGPFRFCECFFRERVQIASLNKLEAKLSDGI